MPGENKTIRLNDGPASGRQLSLDLMRITAMAAVVVLHVSGMKWSEAAAGSFEWHVLNIFDSLVQWAVPVFVMISGSLFLGSEKTVKQIYSKNLLRILTAFIFWSFLYAVGMIFSGNAPKDIVKAFTGGAYHMWFLFMIAGLYMIVPFLRLIVKDEKLTRYFLILSFIFAFVFPQLIKIISVSSGGGALFLEELTGKFRLNFVIGFQFYFVLGYYLNRHVLPGKSAAAVYICGLAGFIFTVLMTVAISGRQDLDPLMFYDSFTLNVLSEAVCVYVFFKRRFDGRSSGRVVSALSKYTFGVYLVHAYFIYFFDTYTGFGPLSFNPVLAVPAVTAAVLIVSFLLSAALNAIPVLRKYIV